MDGVSAGLLKATIVMHITMNTSSKASQYVISIFLFPQVISYNSNLRFPDRFASFEQKDGQTEGGGEEECRTRSRA